MMTSKIALFCLNKLDRIIKAQKDPLPMGRKMSCINYAVRTVVRTTMFHI